jgi:type II secretory ATPase GspE/PulE/Tfp pilus assembly ATPase PilB-like protein
MHARSAADAIRRLLDMQIQPHHLHSGLNLLVCQRLLRSNCECQTTHEHSMNAPHNALSSDPNMDSVCSRAVCPICSGSGYTGRILLTELFPRIERELAKAIMSDADSRYLESLAEGAGMVTLSQQAMTAVHAHRTTLAEFRRHFTP